MLFAKLLKKIAVPVFRVGLSVKRVLENGTIAIVILSFLALFKRKIICLFKAVFLIN